jgi:hypothetical protein
MEGAAGPRVFPTAIPFPSRANTSFTPTPPIQAVRSWAQVPRSTPPISAPFRAIASRSTSATSTSQSRLALLHWSQLKNLMRDFSLFRKTTIRYWERRRIIYNLLLLPPAVLSYAFVDNLNYVGEPHKTYYHYILPLFMLSAVGANICYCLAYALEFIFGSDDPESRWM